LTTSDASSRERPAVARVLAGIQTSEPYYADA